MKAGRKHARRDVKIALPAVILLVLSAAQPALAQRFLFGVKGGTPISSSTLTGVAGSFRTGTGPSYLNIRRYTIGPTVELALPFHVRFQADFPYKRLDRTESRFLGMSFGSIEHVSANNWEFPIMLKYLWQRDTTKPFVTAGGSIRRINSFEAKLEQFIAFPSPGGVSQSTIDEGLTQGGWVVGGGVRFDKGPLKISPEIRYTRWTSERFLPTRNQVEFLLGVMFDFGRRRQPPDNP
ncbi:MAG: hypothetical protein HY651_03080 [Acidobacteria bacterium]|nr:hypothetical protein [Acidobacteriota bacterium]